MKKVPDINDLMEERLILTQGFRRAVTWALCILTASSALGTELGSFGGASSAFGCWTISPAPKYFPLLTYIYVCCVCMYACMYAHFGVQRHIFLWMLIHMCACEGLGWHWVTWSITIHLLYWGKVSCWPWSSPLLLVWLLSLPQRSPIYTSCILRLQVMSTNEHAW